MTNIILSLGMLALLYLAAKQMLATFRRKVQAGDEVGVKFSSDVLNRIIMARTDKGVLVKNEDETGYVTMSLDKVYFRDQKLYRD